MKLLLDRVLRLTTIRDTHTHKTEPLCHNLLRLPLLFYPYQNTNHIFCRVLSPDMFIKTNNLLVFSLVALAQAHKLSIIKHRSVETEVITACTKSDSFALTYDDGPHIYEDKLADYLHDRDIKGTFFLNGNNWNCIYDEEIVAKLKHTFGQGHLIASHTWSHPDITALTDDEFKQQLDLIETAFKKILGIKPRYFRPPYGKINDNNLRILKERGYKVINWSFASRDADGASPSESKNSYDQVAKQYPSPQIALNHETHESTVTDVTPHAISVLQKAGYKLVNVAECLGLQSTSDQFYQSVGQPGTRDSSWTCSGTPQPSPLVRSGHGHIFVR